MQNNTLFPINNTLSIPLAERIRPQALNDVIGQDHLIKTGPLNPDQLMQHSSCPSMILWGPCGTGKTTIARLLARQIGAEFVELSATATSLKQIREVQAAAQQRRQNQQQTLVFIDEIHRFSKSQQDVFLPSVETGLFILVGATTENPSFEINRALLSRLQVYTLNPLDDHALEQILDQAIVHQQEKLAVTIQFADSKTRQNLVQYAMGDARRLLNALELLSTQQNGQTKIVLTQEQIAAQLGIKPAAFGKREDQFYELISVLHKSIRGSHPDAALFWLARMLQGGCDPLYIARRLVRCASEDIGNADLRALELTLNTWNVVERLGMPEGELALAQAVTYLASAPKSNAVYSAFKAAMKSAKQHAEVAVPRHLCNAPTGLMKQLDYGKGYRYAHDEPYGYAAGESYLPDHIKADFYQPVNRGLETKIKARLEFLKALDQQVSKGR